MAFSSKDSNCLKELIMLDAKLTKAVVKLPERCARQMISSRRSSRARARQLFPSLKARRNEDMISPNSYLKTPKKYSRVASSARYKSWLSAFSTTITWRLCQERYDEPVTILARPLLNILQALLRQRSDLPDDLEGVERQRLKHGSGKFSHIVLVPQPSDSPNDPLNVSLSLSTFCVGLGLMASAVANMEKRLHSLPRRNVGGSRWSIRTNAGARLRSDFSRAWDYHRHHLASHCLADPGSWTLCFHHEPAGEDLWQAHHLCFRQYDPCHRLHLGKSLISRTK